MHCQPVMTFFNSLWPTAILVSLPSFLFGYCLSSLNTVLSVGSKDDPIDCYTGEDSSCPKGSILRDVRLTVQQQEIATGLLLAGAWVGCAVANSPMDTFGRRSTTLAANALFIAGGLMMASSSSHYTLSAGRWISGVGVGIVSAVVPVLLSEISTVTERGALTSAHQLAITVGILVSSLMGYAFSDVPHGWRYVQGFTAIPALLQLVLSRKVPESPMWICRQGRQQAAKGGDIAYSQVPRDEEVHSTPMLLTSSSPTSSLTSPLTLNPVAVNSTGVADAIIMTPTASAALCEETTVRAARAVLYQIRPKGWDVEEELAELMSTQTGHNIEDGEKKGEGGGSGGGIVGWLDLWSIRWAMLVGTVVMACQSLTGVNSVVFYSSTIFELAGFDDEILATVLVGVVNVAVTVLSMRLIDRAGRKKLILSGTAMMTGSLAVLSCTLLVPATTGHHHMWLTVQGYICVLAVLTYMSGFAIGFGVVGWVVIAELVPYDYRAKACSVFVSVNWICNVIISLFTLSAIEHLGGIRDDVDMSPTERTEAKKKGVALLYLIFMSVCIFAMFFVFFFVPETSAKITDVSVVVTSLPLRDDGDNIRGGGGIRGGDGGFSGGGGGGGQHGWGRQQHNAAAVGLIVPAAEEMTSVVSSGGEEEEDDDVRTTRPSELKPFL